MKKMIALLLAMVMMLGCLQAVAEETAEAVAAEAPAATTVTKMELSVDKELVKNLIAGAGATEESAGLIDAILDLADALEITGINAAGGAQVDLGMNGKVAVNLGVEEKDGGLLIASTLFPNYILTIPAETIQGMMPQLNVTSAGNGEGTGTSAVFNTASNGIADFIDAVRKIDPELTVSLTASKEGIILQFEQDGQYGAFSIVPEADNVLDLNVFVAEKGKPLATLKISDAEPAERTLSMDPEGKTVLSIADLQGADAAKALEGLQTDMQMGIMQMMAVPEIAKVMAAYTQMMQQTQQTGEPAAEEAAPAENP